VIYTPNLFIKLYDQIFKLKTKARDDTMAFSDVHVFDDYDVRFVAQPTCQPSSFSLLSNSVE